MQIWILLASTVHLLCGSCRKGGGGLMKFASILLLLFPPFPMKCSARQVQFGHKRQSTASACMSPASVGG